jgi:hypothetical protein
MRRWIVVALLMLCGALGARAQDMTTAAAQLDSTKIIVGSPVKLTLEVQHRPLLGTLQWPVIRDTFNHLEVLQRGKIDTQSDGSATLYRQELVLTGFDSGAFAVPPIPFVVKPDAGAPYTAYTEPLPLVVTTVPVDTSKPFMPIRDIVAAPSSLTVNWIIVGVALLLIVLGYYFLLRRRKAKKLAAIQGPKKNGLERLQALEAEGLVKRGALKEHYTKLADIIRDEVAARFKVPARERPTGEILRDAEGKVPAASLPLLKEVLEEADAVKFAKAHPDEQAVAKSMVQARQFLNQTSGTA